MIDFFLIVGVMGPTFVHDLIIYLNCSCVDLLFTGKVQKKYIYKTCIDIKYIMNLIIE